MHKYLALVIALVYGSAWSVVADSSQPKKEAVSAVYASMPLNFETNSGQFAQGDFRARGAGYALYLDATEAVIALKSKERSATLRMELVGADVDAQSTALAPLEGKSHYFISADPSDWHAGVLHHERVRYEGIYRGVDVVYYGNQGRLEYDFIVAPGVSPDVIRLDFSGQDELSIDDQGDLVLDVPGGQIVQQAPYAYQEIDGVRREVASRYVLDGAGQVGFAVSAYDAAQPLVIDPIISYSTFLGGALGGEGILTMRADVLGNVYVSGTGVSCDFPFVNQVQGCAGSADVFITKFDASGQFVYSTFIGGSGTEVSHFLEIDGAGNAHIAGYTNSTNFPVLNAAQGTRPDIGTNWDMFAVKLDASGNLVYSTYIGGGVGDFPYGAELDAAGNFTITGETLSNDFLTHNAFQTSLGSCCHRDATLTRLDANGNLVYSTYLGGNLDDVPGQLEVDGAGNAYIAGRAGSNNFPTLNAVQPSGNADAFAAKFDASGQLVYSTYLGGINSQEEVKGLEVDGAGNAHIVGRTKAANYPTTLNALQATSGGDYDVFVSKLDGAGDFVYSTYLGGWAAEDVFGVALDNADNLYIAGLTPASYPQHNPAQSPPAGIAYNGFVTKIDPSGQFVYSTYVGGNDRDLIHALKVDAAGNAYITGHTNSTDYPAVNAVQGTDPDGSGWDTFASKIDPNGQYVYSTYLGGNGQETMSVHPDRDLYPLGVDGLGRTHIVVGRTASTNFPTTPDAFQSSYKGLNDVAYVRLGAGGALEYATYMGSVNSDIAVGLVVDGQDAATIGGTTTNGGDFPTFNAAQGMYGGGGSDMFVARFGGSSNGPPVADAGADDTAECASPTGTSYALDGSGSSDPDGDGLSYAWYEGGSLIATGVAPNVVLSLGSHTIELVVNDGLLDSDPDEVTIEVVDTTAPVISLVGGAVTLECNIDSYSEPGATALDACEGDMSGSVVIDASNVNAGLPGVYAVTYDVVDAAGNAAAQVVRTVTVVDTTPPVIALVGGAVTLECSVGSYSESGATAVDACDGDVSGSIVIDASAIDISTPGVYGVTYNVADAAGNAADEVVRTVEVVDMVAPVINLGGVNPQVLESGIDAYVELGASALDDCEGDVSGSVAIDASAVNAGVPGSYPVTYNAADAAGNAAIEVVRTVIVQDTTAPTIALDGANPQVLECNIDAYAELGVTVTDASDGDISGSVVIDASAVDASVLGSYTVTYNATDAAGNAAAQVTRTVIVRDTTAPTLALNGDDSLVLVCPAVYVELGAAVSDACDGNPGLTISGTVDGSTPGTYVVTYTAADISGNSAVVQRTVVVTDNIAPVVTLNGLPLITVEVATAFVDPGVSFSDACDPDPILVIDDGGLDTNVPATYVLTYTVTDASGNGTAVQRTVTVVDTTAPTILLTGANPQLLECPAPYAELGATVVDAGDPAPTLAIDASAVNAALPGTYAVVYTATDAAGNVATATRAVVVGDNTAPVVVLNGDAMVTVECNVGVYAELGATASDACDPSPAVVLTGAVDVSALGTYPIVYTATDAAGNSSAVTRTVHVVDTTAPTILTLSEFPDALVDAEADGEEVALAVTAEDACDTELSYAWSEDGNVLGTDATIAATFAIGTHTIEITVSDGAGNATTDTVVLTVVDPTPTELSVTATPGSLWPPNHKYHTIALSIVGNAASFTATAVSDQADDAGGKGDGKTTGDIKATRPDGSVALGSNAAPVVSFDPVNDVLELRAERAGKGQQARTYTIVLTALDAAGNQLATATVALQVVHDQGAAKLVGSFAGEDAAFGVANFPNPFNPETVLQYVLPEAGVVRLAVYNATGQRVRDLVNAYQGVGAYQVLWDGRDASGRTVSAGLYFYRLQVGGQVAVGKMLLTK